MSKITRVKRNVILGTVAFVTLVAAVLVATSKRDAGQPAVVSFIGYEDNGQAAVFQITNICRSPVLYSCRAYYSLRPGRTNYMDGVLGDLVHGVEPHEGLRLRIPMKILANSDVRPSSVQVRYWVREGQFRARFGRLLRSLGANAKTERFEATFDLST